MPKKKTKRRAIKRAQIRSKRAQKKVIEKRAEDFAEELENMGKRIERKGFEWDTWYRKTFGIVGPLISSVFGILMFLILVWIVRFVNASIGSTIITEIADFAVNNIGLFFLASLFFSYSSYLSKSWPRPYRFVSPILTATGFVIGLWLFVRIVSIVNLHTNIEIIWRIVYFIDNNPLIIFLFVAVLGYIIIAIKSDKKEVVYTKTKKQRFQAASRPKRLYRSGNDKILGGVCGGIGEYFGVDPVMIRILWVVAALGFGSGILAYIIAWIIIPRNPRHTWD